LLLFVAFAFCCIFSTSGDPSFFGGTLPVDGT